MINNQKGQSIIILVMLVAAVMLIFQNNIQSLFLNNIRARSRLITKQNVEVYFENIKTNFTNDQIWKRALEENKESFKCLFEGTCKPTDIEQTIVLKDLEGNVISDGDKIGFDSDGNSCDYLLPHCIFKMKVTWKPICTDETNCLNPKVKIIPYLESKSDGSTTNLMSINVEAITEQFEASRTTTDLIQEIKNGN